MHTLHTVVFIWRLQRLNEGVSLVGENATNSNFNRIRFFFSFLSISFLFFHMMRLEEGEEEQLS